jgi:solute carrier family 9 (sodium/hydrogen exchanger), member 8
MYQTIQAAIHLTGASSLETGFLSIASFIMIFLGSFIIGAVIALLMAYLLKKMSSSSSSSSSSGSSHSSHSSEREEYESVEICLMIGSPWVSYLIAQGLGLSGIVSILFNGIVLSQYAAQNLSNPSRKVLKLAYETAAYASETCVFVFLGMGVFAFHHPYRQMGWTLMFGNLVIVHIARGVNVLICTCLCNFRRFKSPITKIFQVKFAFFYAFLVCDVGFWAKRSDWYVFCIFVSF